MGLSASKTRMKSETAQPASDLVGPRISSGCDLIVVNDHARVAFMNFLEHGEWMMRLKEINYDDLMTQHYRLPEGTTLSDFENKFASPLHPEPTTPIDFFQSGNLLTPMLLAYLFPLFLKSREYEDWVLSQTSGSDNSLGEETKRIVRLNELFSKTASTVDTSKLSNKVVVEALQNIDSTELNCTVESGTWLDSLARMVENLPLPVSLATATGGHGFPLVYVNKAFERMSGYNRNEIVGHNCRFLQSASTEQGQVQLLAEALRGAKPTKVALTNVRKDGTEFGNLLAMKPVFDSDGIYTYVVGVQCDISDPAVAHRTIRTVEDLLTILPNILD